MKRRVWVVTSLDLSLLADDAKYAHSVDSVWDNQADAEARADEIDENECYVAQCLEIVLNEPGDLEMADEEEMEEEIA